MKYLPLNVISGYSFLSSALKITDIVSSNKEYGSAYCALSDYQVMYGYKELEEESSKEGLTPLYGIIYKVTYQENKFNLTLYIQSEEGFSNLCQILYLFPQEIPLEEFKKYSKGLIAIFPTLGNELIATDLGYENEKELVSVFSAFDKVFEHFYLGVEYYHQDDLPLVNFLRTLVDKYPFDTVAFNRHLYKKKEDVLTYSILDAIKNDERIEETEIPSKGPYFFLKEGALQKLYLPNELAKTIEIAQLINFKLRKKRGKLLSFNTSSNKKELIKETCLNNFNGFNNIDKYQKRINYELDVIEKMGYLDYFLIVADYVNYAKKQHIPVGPGRGSAAGSLIAYGLGITTVDPLKYNLYFERFLNPERISMPDIDIDFSDIHRNRIVDYIFEKYGDTRMANIVTFQTIGAKQALRDIGRVFNINTADISQLASLIKIPNITLREAYKKIPEFKTLVDDQYFLRIIKLAVLIEGFPRQAGLHAAGVILNDQDLYYSLPVSKGPDGHLTSQFEMGILEDLGFLKMDILGLRNLTIIESCLSKLKRNCIDINLEQINLNDIKTFSILNAGLTSGLFQLESEGMTSTLKEVRIDHFNDLVAVLALYRPGPMEQIKVYAERKNKSLKISYLHEVLEKTLSETYGVIVYQEQIMEIVQNVAGFSLGKADQFRRAISKKNTALLNDLKDQFINGAVANSFKKEVAEEIFSLIDKFANYGFNKSHSVSYALIAYQMAYLKAHYPLYFFAALLDFQVLSDTKYSHYLNEFRKLHVTLKLPDINLSNNQYLVQDNSILIPLTAIKGLSHQNIDSILYEREHFGKFTSFKEFVSRTKEYNISQSSIITLINSGAMDAFSNRSQLRKQTAVYLNSLSISSELIELSEEEMSLMEIKYQENENDRRLNLDKEFETIGILLSGSYLEPYKRQISNAKAITIAESINYSGTITLGVLVINPRVIRTKTNQSMAYLRVLDDTMELSVIVFPDLYNTTHYLLNKRSALLIQGYYKNDRKGISFIATKIDKLEE